MSWSKTDSVVYRCKGTTAKGQPCKCRVGYGEQLCGRCQVRGLAERVAANMARDEAARAASEAEYKRQRLAREGGQ